MSTTPYERSAFAYDLIYSVVKDYEVDAQAVIDTVDRLAPDASSLLDIGCGPGRHLQAFAGRFDDLAGWDLSASMATIARSRNPGVQIDVGDVMEMSLGRPYDIITFLFSGIGYLATPERLARGVQRIAQHLPPAGLAIVDGWLRPDAVDPALMTGAFAVEAADIAVARVDHHAVADGLSTLQMSYSVSTPEGIERFDEEHVLALFTREEYAAAFDAADLEILEIQAASPDRDRYVVTPRS